MGWMGRRPQPAMSSAGYAAAAERINGVESLWFNRGNWEGKGDSCRRTVHIEPMISLGPLLGTEHASSSHFDHYRGLVIRA